MIKKGYGDENLCEFHYDYEFVVGFHGVEQSDDVAVLKCFVDFNFSPQVSEFDMHS